MNPEPWWKRNAVALIGLLLNIGFIFYMCGKLTQKIDQMEIKDMTMERRQDGFENRMAKHHEDSNVHTDKEWRNSVTSRQDRLEGKIDTLIMRTNR